MTTSTSGSGLVHQLIAQHLADAADAGTEWEIGDELPVTPDHVLAGGRAGLLALAACRAVAVQHIRVELALAGADRGAGPAGFETPEELAALHDLARALGLAFSRPGHGRTDLVHGERFAAPGKLLITAGRRATAVGAMGMLSLPVDPLEAAAALAGGAVAVTWPGVSVVALHGTLPPGVGGLDLLLDVAATMPEPQVTGRFLELAGPAVLALSMADRLAIASRAPDLAFRAAWIPSDEVTREYLRGQGREADWKGLAMEMVEGAADMEIELSAVEPRCAPLARPADSRRCRESGAPRVSAVELGVDASIGDLETLAWMLDGHRVAEGLRVEVVPGTRQVMETARIRGVLDRLVAAGVRVLEVGTRSTLPPLPGHEALGVCFGVRPEDGDVRRGRWMIAGSQTCAAAARTGRLVDPRTLDVPAMPDRQAGLPVRTDEWILPAGNVEERGAQAAGEANGIPIGVPLRAPLRGVVLLCAGDGVRAEQILPWGARLRPYIRDVERLGHHVLTTLDPAFPDRARAHNGGFVVAGADFGHGVTRDPAALAPRALGVRAVFAVSFDRAYRRQLVNAGVLPLRFAVPADRADLAPGDELELPGLPEALEEGVPLVVRNLTRGTQFTVRHDLNERMLSILAAGGVLRHALVARA